jgi:RNAse (barnase) inhibitor barstar
MRLESTVTDTLDEHGEPEELDETSGSPDRFAMVNEDEDSVLCSSRGIDGFFVERRPGPQAWRTFWLLGSSPLGELKRYCERIDHSPQQLGNVEIRVLDHDGATIGSYFVGGASAQRYRPHFADPALVDIAVNGLLLSQPHPLAAGIWEQWRIGRPTDRARWAAYSRDGREAWLEVVRLHARWDRRRTADAPPGRTVELDGAEITDPPSFYCAIGEAVNGPGGYFGANLDGLRDCLRGGFGATVPFTLVWHAAEVARGQLSNLAEIMGVLREGGVTVEQR